jgi:hypothetical protein
MEQYTEQERKLMVMLSLATILWKDYKVNTKDYIPNIEDFEEIIYKKFDKFFDRADDVQIIVALQGMVLTLFKELIES